MVESVDSYFFFLMQLFFFHKFPTLLNSNGLSSKKIYLSYIFPLDANLEKRKKYKSGISNRYILSRTKDYTRNESLQNNQQKKKPKIVHGNAFLW